MSDSVEEGCGQRPVVVRGRKVLCCVSFVRRAGEREGGRELSVVAGRWPNVRLPREQSLNGRMGSGSHVSLGSILLDDCNRDSRDRSNCAS